jgi:hypothetical protein
MSSIRDTWQEVQFSSQTYFQVGIRDTWGFLPFSWWISLRSKKWVSIRSYMKMMGHTKDGGGVGVPSPNKCTLKVRPHLDMYQLIDQGVLAVEG